MPRCYLVVNEQDKVSSGDSAGNTGAKELLEKAGQALYDTMDRLQQHPDPDDVSFYQYLLAIGLIS